MTRHAPNSSESSNAGPRTARARLRAAARDVAVEDDVEVRGRAPEQAVAHGAADEPGRLPGERLAERRGRVAHGAAWRGERLVGAAHRLAVAVMLARHARQQAAG